MTNIDLWTVPQKYPKCIFSTIQVLNKDQVRHAYIKCYNMIQEQAPFTSIFITKNIKLDYGVLTISY